jgi:hypothetical protein
MGLEEAGLLTKTKSGRANAWMPASDIVEKLNGNPYVLQCLRELRQRGIITAGYR